jgi:hypothetical protein
LSQQLHFFLPSTSSRHHVVEGLQEQLLRLLQASQRVWQERFGLGSQTHKTTEKGRRAPAIGFPPFPLPTFLPRTRSNALAIRADSTSNSRSSAVSNRRMSFMTISAMATGCHTHKKKPERQASQMHHSETAATASCSHTRHGIRDTSTCTAKPPPPYPHKSRSPSKNRTSQSRGAWSRLCALPEATDTPVL